MSVRNFTTAVVASAAVAGWASAQDPSPTPQPAPTQPVPMGTVPEMVQPAPTMTPGVVQGGYVAPMTFTYPPVVQTGYAAPPVPYYPQGQVMAGGFAAPMIVSRPGMMTTYGVAPAAGFPVFGSPTVVAGPAYPAATMTSGGFVSNVVSYPTRTARRLFRR